MTLVLPPSAISSWGGFVYQGKVALYHSICLLCDKEFQGTALTSFNLQLDSTDDFAIYDTVRAISVHQVKAKIALYRSAFEIALDKSSKIETDCNASTVRYFHIANMIDDFSDYTNAAGAIVKFYQYGANSFCRLEDIEKLTKLKIEEYLIKNSLPCTPILLDKKYCHLSELITSKVVAIHSEIHKGISQNKAAYTEAIASSELEVILRENFNSVEDVPYQLIKLRTIFSYAFEYYIAAATDLFTTEQIKEFGMVHRFIHSMNDDDLLSVMHSLRPSARNEEIRKDDIRFYADIVTEISRKMILIGIPHYLENLKRYLPTSIKVSDKWAPVFQSELLEEIRQNPKLANILYEYNVLITGTEPHTEINILAQSSKITEISDTEKSVSNIIREFPISIISINVAKRELNA